MTQRHLRARFISLLLGVSLASVSAHAEPRELERESEVARAEAKGMYERAVRAYKARHYREAIELFLAADRLAPRAALSFDVGRAYDQLGDGRAALRCYREYLRRSPSASNRDSVQHRIGELESQLVAEGVQQVTIISEPATAELRIDGKESGVTPWTAELTPGKHRIRLSRAGYSAILHEFELPRERALLVQVSLSPLPAVDASLATPWSGKQDPNAVRITAEPPAALKGGNSARPIGWVALGAGGASLLAAGVFELLRAGAQNEARDPNTSQARHLDRLADSERYQTTSRVLLGVGAGVALAGGALLLFSMNRDPERAGFNTASLSCGPTACGIGFGTRFQ